MKKNNFIAFTLLELMIVITIVGIISMATYIPYAHHQKKVLIKQAAREITQSLSDARNLAIHGLNTGSGNLNIGLFFASGATSIQYYTSTGSLSLGSLLPSDIYREKKLPSGIVIDSINSVSQDTLFQFSAISGTGSIEPTVPFGDEIDIQISYKGSADSILQKNITYYSSSYISDY